MGVAADLKVFCAASMPKIDTGTSGGAIDLLRRPIFQQLTSGLIVEALSSAAGDTTPTVTIDGRRLDGTVSSETKTLTGTTPIVFSTLGAISRVLKVELSATATGTVTVRAQAGGEVVGTILPAERGLMAAHREGQASLGQSELFYYKVFAKNTHATHSLGIASILEVTDILSRVDFALAASKDDSGSVTNRKTSPGLTFNSLEKAVPTGSLAAGEAIGIWLRFTHPAGEAGLGSALSIRVKGATFA